MGGYVLEVSADARVYDCENKQQRLDIVSGVIAEDCPCLRSHIIRGLCPVCPVPFCWNDHVSSMVI